MESLQLENICKVFQNGQERLEILRGLSLIIHRHETVAVTGESGTGKSTLLNIAGCIDSATSGSVRLDNLDISALGEEELVLVRRKHMGFIFQFHYLLKEFTALENTMLPLYMQGVPRRNCEKKALELIGRVGLSNRKDHYPAQLSGGERQRIAIARALINEPDILFADEPTGNLDERNSNIVQQLIREVAAERETSLLLITHDFNFARSMRNHYILEGGRLTGS